MYVSFMWVPFATTLAWALFLAFPQHTSAHAQIEIGGWWIWVGGCVVGFNNGGTEATG